MLPSLFAFVFCSGLRMQLGLGTPAPGVKTWRLPSTVLPARLLGLSPKRNGHASICAKYREVGWHPPNGRVAGECFSTLHSISLTRVNYCLRDPTWDYQKTMALFLGMANCKTLFYCRKHCVDDFMINCWCHFCCMSWQVIVQLPCGNGRIVPFVARVTRCVCMCVCCDIVDVYFDPPVLNKIWPDLGN